MSGSSARVPVGVGESAIIVPVEVPVAVRRLRERLDPAAADGVPAHVTLLYPFMPAEALTDDVRAEIARLVVEQPAFPFALTRVERWPDVVWLAPEPAAPFRRLTERLATAFPDYPPYGGIHDEVIPHLAAGAVLAECARRGLGVPIRLEAEAHVAGERERRLSAARVRAMDEGSADRAEDHTREVLSKCETIAPGGTAWTHGGK